MNVLRDQLKGLPGGMRQSMEAKITTSIMKMVHAVGALEQSSDRLNLTLLCEVANIKAVINLAQSLHQPQASVTQQDPNES